MSKTRQASMMFMCPMGSARDVSAGFGRCSNTAPISGALSKPNSAEPHPSKGGSRATTKFSVQDVDRFSNVSVPGYTTPLTSSKCVVQDETDIPVALSPVSMGFHTGVWMGDTKSSATEPFSALQAGG